MVEMTFMPRTALKESKAKQLVRGDYIPFVMYASGTENTVGMVKKVDVQSLLRNVRPGFLPTTKIVLKDDSGKTFEVLVKEIQYKPTTYDVIHLDFLQLLPNKKVKVKVPVDLLNQVDCIGVKMGGFLRQVMRHVRVSCLPKDIPSHFEVDLLNLDVGQVRKVQDLQMSKDVTPLAHANDIVVNISKR